MEDILSACKHSLAMTILATPEYVYDVSPRLDGWPIEYEETVKIAFVIGTKESLSIDRSNRTHAIMNLVAELLGINYERKLWT